MAELLEVIAEDFSSTLSTIRRLLAKAYDTGGAIDAELRTSASNAAILLLASSFEDYVRETVREYATTLLAGITQFASLPKPLPSSVGSDSV